MGAVVAVAIVALAGYIWIKNDKEIETANQNFDTTPKAYDTLASTSSANQPTATKTTSKTPVKSTIAAEIKYSEALNLYRNAGRYYQFVNCSATPGTMTLKAGTKLMFDNRENKPHKIAIGKVSSYNVSSYGFAIATAPSAAGQYYITCDGGGAALLNVEK